MIPQTKDHRVFDRFVARFPTKFKYSRNDYGTEVFLRDLSAGGAKIFTKDRVFLNDRIDLLVEVPDGRDPMELKGSAVWSKPQGPGQWDVGIRFDDLKLMSLQRLYRFCQ